MNGGVLLLLLPALLVRRALELLGGKSLRCWLGRHPCARWTVCTCYCHMGP